MANALTARNIKSMVLKLLQVPLVVLWISDLVCHKLNCGVKL